MKKKLINYLVGLSLFTCIFYAHEALQGVPYGEIEKDGEVFMYREAPFTGVTFSVYASGVRKMELSVRNGKLEGVTREWTEDGVLQAETYFREGQRHGSNKYWFADGTLMKDQVYEKGIMVSSELFDHGKLVE